MIFAIILSLGFFATACSVNKKDDTNTKPKNVTKKGIDYLVLVNKYSQLPDDWEDNVELVTAKDAWGDDIKVEKKAYKKYQELKKALEDEGIIIELDSVYRSVKEQQELWDEWSNDPEKGIDYVRQYVAVPGYSEHHTGLALDIVIKKDGELIYENDDMIAEREIFEKIHEKLADYGFILRYLEGKDDITGYAYEPWHLRYIDDVTIAKEIMNNNLTFEEYLESVKDIKSVPEAAKYQIEKALQKYLKETYEDKITTAKFNVTKIYTTKEEQENEGIKTLNLGKNDVAFSVTYQLQPADDSYIDELTLVDGEYDEELGMIKNISRLGVLKYNSEDDSYSIDNFGTGW